MLKAPEPGTPESGITAIAFELGAPPRAIPIAYAPGLWPTLCTLADAQRTLETIKALDTSSRGGADSVTIDASIMDFSGQGEFALISIPEKSSVRNYCIAGKATKAGVEYVIDEYGALVPDRLELGWSVPRPTDVLKLTINADSGLTFHWGAA